MTRISATLTTGEILSELGARLRAYRLQQNRTLEDVAEQAGVGFRPLRSAIAGPGLLGDIHEGAVLLEPVGAESCTQRAEDLAGGERGGDSSHGPCGCVCG